MFKSITPYVLLFLIISSLIQRSAFCQSEPLKTIEKQLNSYAENNLQEKVFVHMDKSFYLTGEKIWFKVYVVDGITHKQLSLSKVVYVEVLDKDSKAVLQGKIELKRGIGNGSFYIPTTLNSGNYILRTYTNWMKNFSQEFFFQKEISILNSAKKLGAKPEENNNTFDIQFYPEGGSLVNGLESKVAFRAVDKSSRGVLFKGFILNDKNDTITRFEPMKFGIGNFLFKPLDNEKYRALIVSGTGTSISKDLPMISEEGFVMKLEENGDSINIDVTVGGNTAAGSNGLYLIGHTRQVVKVAEYGFVNGNKASFVIDRQKLGEGISHITVFNQLKQPLCERLYFKQPSNNIEIKLKTNKEGFASREKVSLDITSALSKNTSADLSISAFRLDSLESGGGEDIYTYLWLTSELGGKVEEPQYYLNNKDSNVKEAVDNLMLTHGWRRFKWNSILMEDAKKIKFIPETSNMIITTLLTNRNTGQPARNIMTYLSSPGKMTQFNVAKTDSSGLARIPVGQFYGSKEIVVQTNTERDSIYKIILVSPFADSSENLSTSAFNLSETYENTIVNRSIGAQVEYAYLKEKKSQYKIPLVDSLPFYSATDKNYLLDAFTRFPSVEEVMREYVPSVAVRKRKGEFHFLVFDKSKELFFENDPLILLDGTPIFDTDKIIGFDPLKIKKMEVVDQRYFLGPLVSEGVVNYTTYSGDLAGFELDPRALFIEYDGLQLQREFYSPIYETDQDRSSRIPDFRNLLYWSPSIIMDTLGKKVEFYTSDIAGKYAVIVQGISTDGKAGSQVITFEVKKPL